jgi:hypothetical protein
MTAKAKSASNTWIDPDAAPEITEEWAAGAEVRHGKKIIRRGRPSGIAKTPTTVRLDNEILGNRATLAIETQRGSRRLA